MSEDAGAVGRVLQVAIYPVKSLAGCTVREARVEAGGLVGDRAWTVLDPGGQRVSPKDAPAMRTVVATGDPEADQTTLAAVLGRPVRLDRAEAPAVDAAAVHLVSRQAIARAEAGVVPAGCSADDPRANLLVDLPDGADERGWVGRRLRIGQVELAVVRTPKHCLGVYAEVTGPGRVAPGDAVTLVPEPG